MAAALADTVLSAGLLWGLRLYLDIGTILPLVGLPTSCEQSKRTALLGWLPPRTRSVGRAPPEGGARVRGERPGTGNRRLGLTPTLLVRRLRCPRGGAVAATGWWLDRGTDKPGRSFWLLVLMVTLLIGGGREVVLFSCDRWWGTVGRRTLGALWAPPLA